MSNKGRRTLGNMLQNSLGGPKLTLAKGAMRALKLGRCGKATRQVQNAASSEHKSMMENIIY